MTFYTKYQIVHQLEIDEGFVGSLEREEIIVRDAPPDAEGEYSERMLERVRVAYNLVYELDVNLAGAAIILRMREQLADTRRTLESFLAESERRGR